MTIKIELKDFIVYVLILLVFLFSLFAYINLRSALGNAALVNLVNTHEQNFRVVDQGLKDMSKAIQEIKLGQTIQQNVIGSGEVKKAK